jgi:hypothetical protein
MPGVLFIGPVAPPATAPMCDPSPGASVFALAAPAGELFVVERVVFVCFSQFCGPCCNLGLFQGPSCILAAQVLIYMAFVKKKREYLWVPPLHMKTCCKHAALWG